MNKYEILYIISADVSEEKREELIKKFSSYVESKKAPCLELINGE